MDGHEKYLKCWECHGDGVIPAGMLPCPRCTSKTVAYIDEASLCQINKHFELTGFCLLCSGSFWIPDTTYEQKILDELSFFGDMDKTCETCRGTGLRGTVKKTSDDNIKGLQLEVDVSGNKKLEFYFRKIGQVWEIRKVDSPRSTGLFPQLKGFRIIHNLLSHSRTRISCQMLDGGDLSSEIDHATKQLHQPILDKTSIKLYEEAKKRIQDRIDGAENEEDLEKLKIEMQSFDVFMNAKGVLGRSREFGDAAEKSRLNVYRAIQKVYSVFWESNEVDILGHLKATIKTGQHCAHFPDDHCKVSWILK